MAEESDLNERENLIGPESTTSVAAIAKLQWKSVDGWHCRE
jgi:hypothetical protein